MDTKEATPPTYENMNTNDCDKAAGRSTPQSAQPVVPIESQSNADECKETDERRDDKTLPYKCSQCSQGFEWVMSLDLHIAAAHHGLRSAADPGLFGCQVCSQYFKTHESLYSHSKVHREEETVTCTMCGQGFPSNSDCRQHMVTHTITISP